MIKLVVASQGTSCALVRKVDVADRVHECPQGHQELQEEKLKILIYSSLNQFKRSTPKGKSLTLKSKKI